MCICMGTLVFNSPLKKKKVFGNQLRTYPQKIMNYVAVFCSFDVCALELFVRRNAFNVIGTVFPAITIYVAPMRSEFIVASTSVNNDITMYVETCHRINVDGQDAR